MKKNKMKVYVRFFSLFLIFLTLSISLTSAFGFSDFWNKITGRVSGEITIAGDSGEELIFGGDSSFELDDASAFEIYLDGLLFSPGIIE